MAFIEPAPTRSDSQCYLARGSFFIQESMTRHFRIATDDARHAQLDVKVLQRQRRQVELVMAFLLVRGLIE